MLISVVVPVYNVEKYIGACLESIIESGLDCEVIMVDDGSTDKSPDICKKYAKKYSNFSFFRNQGKGLSDARNMGIDKARGEYIWFVDSDDLICGDFQAVKLAVLTEKPDVIAFDATAFNETQGKWNLEHYDRREKIGDIKTISGKEFFRSYYLQNAYRDSACLNIYKKEFLHKNRIQFISGLFYEDTEFTFHVYMTAGRVKYIPQIYYNRRYRYGSIMTTEINEKKIGDFFIALIKNTKLMELNRADESLNYVFARYVFDMYSVQLGRIDQSDVKDKERYCFKAFELFLQAFQRVADQINLSNINMILTYMNRVEDIAGQQISEQREYLWKGNRYNWTELRRVFLRQHKLLIQKVLGRLPLDKDVPVGIYGIGKHTERMLEEYQRYVGKIKAKLIFLDSSAPSCTVVFHGCNVLNIKDIPKELESVIISSYRYQNEMYQKLIEVKYKKDIISFYLKEDTFDYFI